MTNPKQRQSTRTESEERSEPLESVADINETDYIKVIYDGCIIWTIEEEGRKRAPSRKSVWRHQMGLAGEVAVGTVLGVRANWETYEDYIGDCGYDLKDDDNRIEVKTVRYGSELELKIPESQLQTADHFVLTRARESLQLIEVIGHVSQDELKEFGDRSPYDDLIRVKPKYIRPFNIARGPVSPEKVRAVQSM